MESDEPADHSHNPHLSPPFDFVPSSVLSPADYGSPVAHNSYLYDGVRDNPDDFYRPFADRPSHPDIIVDYGDQDAMSSSTSAKRKAPHINGTTPKSTSSPVPVAKRSSLQPVSGPSTPLSVAKSSPSLSTSSRLQNGSIKDRIKQFEQVRGSPGGGKTRAAPATKPSSSSVSSPLSGTRPIRGGHGASSLRGSKATGRPPLFGEVVDMEAKEDDVGYGISTVTKPHTDDMPSSMRHPNPMFSRSRSQSASEASGDLELMQDESPVDPVYSPRRLDGLGAQVLSPSRIPVKMRRASDIGPLNGTITPPASGGAERLSRTLSPHQAAIGHQRTSSSTSTPPPPLSARRYSPKKHVEPSQMLNAIVKPPLPKHSPPLRSSRPRQPVSTATTSASRAKASERYRPPNGSMNELVQANGRRANPKAVPGIDPTARGSRSPNRLYKEPKPAPEKPNVLRKKGIESKSTEAIGSLPVLEPVAYNPQRSVPELTLNTVNNGISESEPPSSTSDTSHIDIDENPILDSGDSYRSASPALQNDLLRQVLEIRQQNIDTTPRTQAVEDFLSERDDAETIQVLLGATPVLPEANWRDPETPSDVLLSPIPDRDESEGGFLDNRSSLRPDDSVSMVFGRKYQARNDSPPPMPPIPDSIDPLDQSFLSGSVLSEISRILEKYQSGTVTQDMANQFRQQVETMSPELPQHDEWDAADTTQSYLQSILDFYSPPKPVAEPSRRISNEQLVSPITADISPEIGEPGVAIIYGSPQRYSRDSISSIGGSVAQHSHTASNATLRPSHFENDGRDTPTARIRADSRPTPPPKAAQRTTTHQYFTGSGPYQDGSSLPQILQLPEPSSGADGLGLTVDTHRPVTPTSPMPVAPGYAPPLPPTPKFEPIGTQNRYHSPVSPSVYSRDPFSTSRPTTSPPKPARVGPIDSMIDGGVISAKTSADISRLGDSRSGSIDTWRSTTESIPTPTTIEDKEKKIKDRRNLIKELVDTESSFGQDMTIMEDIYMGTSMGILSDADRKTVFNNLDQVRAFSVEFLDELKRAVSSVYVIPPENRWNHKRGSFSTSQSSGTENSALPVDKEFHALDHQTIIGKTFMERLPKMEKVYGDYIKNLTAANERLKELQGAAEVKLWLQECHACAKDITQAWNLDALLVKPTQRVTKYPLLLDALAKATPPDHPDYSSLRNAFEDMTNAIHRINEAKRRAELVDQAMNRKRKEPDSKMRVGKLLNRRAERLKQTVGFTTSADDQSYEAIAQKFGGHFFQLQIVMRDIEKYQEDLQESISWLTSFTRSLVQFCQVESHERFPEYESSWIRFGQAMTEVFEIALSDHINKVRKSVIEPILTLWKLHEGPQKIMQKRKKRLVDHVRYKTMIQRGEKPDKRLQLEEDQFNAVNDTLKDELPKLYTLTKKLVEACLMNFVDLQAEWMNTWERKTAPFVDNRERLPTEIGQYIAMIQSTFNQDSAEWEARLKSLAICNGSTLADAQNFLSPTTTWAQDDGSSQKRPSTMGSSRRTLSIDNEQPVHQTPASTYRISNTMVYSPSPLLGSFPLPEGLAQSSNNRTRASSAMSSRGPSTPQSFSTQYPMPGAFSATRPSTSSERNPDRTTQIDYATAQELEYETNFMLDQERESGRSHESPEERFSGIFQSALPMSDSPPSSSPRLPEDSDARVLFLAASLFEFNIDGSRREAGYPYLRYVPGEVSRPSIPIETDC